jgi:hypothetical protein
LRQGQWQQHISYGGIGGHISGLDFELLGFQPYMGEPCLTVQPNLRKP